MRRSAKTSAGRFQISNLLFSPHVLNCCLSADSWSLAAVLDENYTASSFHDPPVAIRAMQCFSIAMQQIYGKRNELRKTNLYFYIKFNETAWL
jgi:hypothetical protein